MIAVILVVGSTEDSYMYFYSMTCYVAGTVLEYLVPVPRMHLGTSTQRHGTVHTYLLSIDMKTCVLEYALMSWQ